jgi:membrane fusion protein, multidrug efflux system
VTLTLTKQAGVAIVPAQAVQTGQDGYFVYVVKEDKAVEMRTVEVGSTQNGRTVVQSGVSAGEVVVTDGHLRLVPGAKVEIKSGPTGGAEARS